MLFRSSLARAHHCHRLFRVHHDAHGRGTAPRPLGRTLSGVHVRGTWYYAGIRAIGAARAGIFINLVPVFAIAMGYVILDEPVTSSLISGGAMVISGVWLANRPVSS